MDGRRFDTLTRALAAATPRRRVLGVLAGSLAAGLLGRGDRRPAAAACRAAGRLCAQDGNCRAPATCDPATRACVCPPGTENCRGASKAAADYESDVLNCGGF